MQSLPVPPLAQTLDRYLETVRPLLTPDEFQNTEAAVQDFRDDDSHLQEELILCSEVQQRQGQSWLTPLWFETYMRERLPLTQSTNVAFELEWPFDSLGTSGAANFVVKLSSVYLQYLSGQWTADYSPRGARFTDDQWRLLSGGLRVRRRKKDKFVDGVRGTTDRNIIVLRDGNAFVVPVTDEEGLAISASVLTNTFAGIVGEVEKPGSFTLPSHLNARDGVKFAEEALKHSHNKRVEKTLRDALFVLDLADDPTAQGTENALVQLGFGVDSSYALKPASFQFGLKDGFVGVELEHSTLDGATLQSLILKAQEAPPPTDVSPVSQVVPAPLTWKLSKVQRHWLEREAARVEKAARGMEVDIVTVPFHVEGDLRFSADAAMQWVLMYASMATWGEVRSTYEAVDMREFRGGRTESFRPHTQSAITFVSALLAGDATWEEYEAAAHAHSEQVKNAKMGNGIERHLYGLSQMARSTGEAPTLFEDEGYKVLTENFLSTTSLGRPEGIIRMAFAPATKKGIGVNYTRVPEGFEYCLTFDRAAQTKEDLQNEATFEENLAAGAKALNDFLNTREN